MTQLSSIQLLDNGIYQAMFADGSVALYHELIAVDFDGEANASYTNDQLGIALNNIQVAATVDEATQATILEQLNANAVEGVLYVNSADAALADLDTSATSTIYVGDTDDLASLGSFAGIAETTGDFAAATQGDNGFVLTGSDFSADSLADTIAHEAGHLMGSIEHDFGNDGISVDDFMATYSTHTTIASGETMTLNAGDVVSVGVYEGYGAGIYKNGASLLSAEGTQDNPVIFSGNTASEDGGGLYRDTRSQTTLSHVVFTRNTANDGAAICTQGGMYGLYILYGTFTYNSTNGGGAALRGYESPTSLTSCVFSNNSSAINYYFYASGNGLYLQDCQFLTSTDTISLYINDGYFRLYGTNIFNADITVTGGDNTIYAGTSTLQFQNTTNITITGTVQDGSEFDFDGTATVNFNTTKDLSSATVTIASKEQSLIGGGYTVATGVSGLYDKTVTYGGESVVVNATDSPVTFDDTTHTLTVGGLEFSPMLASTVTTLKFVDSSYTEDFDTQTVGSAKNIIGSGIDKTTLTGSLYAAGNTLAMSDLDYKGRIYGGSIYTDDGSFAGATVTLDGVKIESIESSGTTTYSRIYGGVDVTADSKTLTGTGNISLSIDLASGSTVGNVYGGGSLSQTGCTYNLGTVTTTISGSGYFKYYVGNGTQANSSCSVNQGASTLNISGGTFASFVYAGGYNQAEQSTATSVQCGNTTLNITGGTFCSNVFGGCVAASDISYAQYTTVDGSCSVTVDTSETNTVIFERNLIAGSNGSGAVTGDTTLTFTGLGSNLTFSGTTAGTGYVMGGCTGDKGRENSPSAVNGTRKLVFSAFTGDFGANARNSFDTISFSGSSVTFKGTQEVDLRGVDTWEFDISDDIVDLTWTSTGCADAENNFAGDQLVITGDVTGSKVLMSGDDTTLNGWTGIGSLVIGGSTYTNKGQADGYVKFGTDTTENYKLSVVSGNLTLATL